MFYFRDNILKVDGYGRAKRKGIQQIGDTKSNLLSNCFAAVRKLFKGLPRCCSILAKIVRSVLVDCLPAFQWVGQTTGLDTFAQTKM